MPAAQLGGIEAKIIAQRIEHTGVSGSAATLCTAWSAGAAQLA
ncbi:MAG TPA: hypothetical protein VIY51_26025 [Xanthobacteraceae bacterium]